MGGLTAVVIVGHNSAHWLHNCLETLVSEMQPGGLIVYVDNASTDLSREIAYSFPSVTVRSEPQNRGFGAGCNAGAELARSAGADYLFFLNPDTQTQWPAIAECVELLESRPAVGMTGPLQKTLSASSPARYNTWTRRIVHPLSTGDVLIDRLLNPLSDAAFENWLQNAPSFVQTQYVNGAALCMRQELYSELGGFDERYFMFFEEVALCRDVRARGYTVGLCTAASIRHAWGGHDTRARSRAWARSKYFYLLSDPGMSCPQRLRRFLREIARDLLRDRTDWAHAFIGFCTLASSMPTLRHPYRPTH